MVVADVDVDVRALPSSLLLGLSFCHFPASLSLSLRPAGWLVWPRYPQLSTFHSRSKQRTTSNKQQGEPFFPSSASPLWHREPGLRMSRSRAICPSTFLLRSWFRIGPSGLAKCTHPQQRRASSPGRSSFLRLLRLLRLYLSNALFAPPPRPALSSGSQPSPPVCASKKKRKKSKPSAEQTDVGPASKVPHLTLPHRTRPCRIYRSYPNTRFLHNPLTTGDTKFGGMGLETARIWQPAGGRFIEDSIQLSRHEQGKAR